MYDSYLQYLLFASVPVAIILAAVAALNSAPTLWYKIQKLFYESSRLANFNLVIKVQIASVKFQLSFRRISGEISE